MILLRLISWPYLRKHLLRSVLTVSGIVLGVGALVGIRMANETALGSFHDTLDKVAGSTQLQVTAGEIGFPEDVLERVQSVAGVRVASPVIEAEVATEMPGQGNLLVLGVDMTGDRGIRNYDLDAADDLVIDDPLVFLAQPDSIIVTREFAARNRLQVNSHVPMRTMEGEKEFTIRGIMRSGDMAGAFGGNLAIMDVYAVQKLLGKGRRFDRIDIAVSEGRDVDAMRRAIQGVVGAGLTVEPPAGRGQRFDAMMSAHRTVINVSSAFVLLIGMFIIYNSFAIAVTQRRYEIGVLRALGASRRQIGTLFLAESLVEGVIGSGLGLLLGLLLARVLMGLFGQMLDSFYSIPDPGGASPAADPRLLGLSFALGVVTSIVAAWIPAREAAAVDPVLALQKGKDQAISDHETRLRLWIALALAVAAVGGLLLGRYRPARYVSLALIVTVALLMAPAAALRIMRAMRPLLCRLWPVEGALAVDSLIQAPRRTAGAVAALMLSLTLVIGTGGTANAFYKSISEWTTAAISADLLVGASLSLGNKPYRFPASLGEKLKTVPGIDEVQTVSSQRIIFRGVSIGLMCFEMESKRPRATRKVTEGDADEMYRLSAAGQGVIASEALAGIHHLRLGETVEIAAPGGLLRLPIVGVVEDYSDLRGGFLIDRKLYQRYWNDDSVQLFRIYLQPGAQLEAVRQTILDRYGNQTRLFVFTNQSLHDAIDKAIGQAMNIVYAQVFVAIFVSVLGIVNSLTVSIIDRRRELGVLQAVGAFRRQVRHTIWTEAVCVGIVGVLMGLALGAVYVYYSLKVFPADLSGVTMPYTYPVKIALLLFPIILGVAFLAAIGPAESAVRGSLVEALEYE